MKDNKKLMMFFEWKDSHLKPIKSFDPKSKLDDKIWNSYELKPKISSQLLEIGRDFFESTDIKAKVKDIVLCGSLCNYNWSSEYSDFDIHIIIDLSEISDDLELSEQLCDLSKKIWNSKNDIKISGYDVEVAIQDYKDLEKSISDGKMGGVYSLIDGEWIKKPQKMDNIEIDSKSLEEISVPIMEVIDDLEKKVKSNNYIYDEINGGLKIIWKKIKRLREKSLQSDGEWGLGNLVFKLMRRNGYMQKIMDLKNEIYKKKFK